MVGAAIRNQCGKGFMESPAKNISVCKSGIAKL